MFVRDDIPNKGCRICNIWESLRVAHMRNLTVTLIKHIGCITRTGGCDTSTRPQTDRKGVEEPSRHGRAAAVLPAVRSVHLEPRAGRGGPRRCVAAVVGGGHGGGGLSHDGQGDVRWPSAREEETERGRAPSVSDQLRGTGGEERQASCFLWSSSSSAAHHHRRLLLLLLLPDRRRPTYSWHGVNEPFSS